MSIWLVLDTQKRQKKSDEAESLARRHKFSYRLHGKFVYVLLSPEVDFTGWVAIWLAERLPAMSRVNLNPAFEGNSNFCCRKTSRLHSPRWKSTGFRKGDVYVTFTPAITPNQLLVSFLEVLFTLNWRLKFLKYDWLMLGSTFQRCVLSRCENEQTQWVEHLIKDLHSFGITIKLWPVSELERNCDLLSERYVSLVKGGRIHVTVRQFDKCAFY